MKKADVIQSYTKGYVTSVDGTTIGYRQLGSGPGLILVHGGLQAAQNFMKLATALSGIFTVYIPDRRGRGLSGGYGNNYSIKKECDDIGVLVNKTGAHNIFGLSSGALISLNAALNNTAIHKLAIYEPPVSFDKSLADFNFVTRYEREMANGNLAGAFLTIITGLNLSRMFNLIPRFIMEPLFKYLLKSDDADKNDDKVSLKALIPTFHYDYLLVTETAGAPEKYGSVRAEVLLMSGSKSPRFLKNTIAGLQNIIPKAQHIEFPGLDHLAADDTGKPEIVAAELRRFFGKG